MDSSSSQHKTKTMFHCLLHMNQQKNKKDLIDVVLLIRPKVDGLVKH
jgi:hypothetical protein